MAVHAAVRGTAVVTQQSGAEILNSPLLYLDALPNLIGGLYKAITQILVYTVTHHGPAERA